MATSDIQQNLVEHGLDPSDYDVDFDKNACEGVAVGDRVEVTQDAEDIGVFADDEGEVLAFYFQGKGLFNPKEHWCAIVALDGMDPMGVPVQILRSLA